MIRCRTVRRLQVHATRDQISPNAVKTFEVAKFPIGHTAVCSCMASEGKVRTADCDGLRIFDDGNGEIARFSGKNVRAEMQDDGSLLIYRLPPQLTQDSADPYLVPLESWGPREAKAALRLANKRNEEFWEPQKGTELWKHLNQENK